MQSLSDDERREVLGEVLSDELKAILEYVKDVPGLRRDLGSLKDDVAELKADMTVVRAGITDVSKQVNDYQWQLDRLEAAS